MAALGVACPACRTPLRFRDSDPVVSPFDCPECGTSLALDAAGAAVPAERVSLAAVAEDRSHARDVDASSILDAAPHATPARARSFDQLDATPRDPSADRESKLSAAGRAGSPFDRLRTPAGIAWTTAAVLGLAVVAALMLPGERERTKDDGDSTQSADSDEPTDEPTDEPSVSIDERRERLVELGRRLGAFRGRHGRLPAGAAIESLPVDERLSWLARLEASGPLGTVEPPRWERSFRDPANAEFVQRPRPAFLNPALEATRAPDGYPATHFVGVGGVGADAPGLPASHSRAGMFGTGRAASPEEVGDGLANTMLVAGVTSNLGSWAAGGAGTVRPFTAEPYVDGPDGFGTGHAGEMLVLMGDGSVRTISAATDPRVVRRMAAMHDGLDLALERPGEPGDRPSAEAEPPEVAVVDPPPAPVDDPPAPPGEHDPPAVGDDPPPEIALPELPKWTPELVAAKLAQPIAGLRTTRPVEAAILLEEVADMIGVPIQLKAEDGIDQSFLDEPITLSVEKGTVGDALDALLAKLELRYVVEADGLRLKPRASGGR
jgi:hypothetical protein